MRSPTLLVALITACSGGDPDTFADPLPDPADDADIFVAALGDPVPWLDAETLARFERGREVMERAFTPPEGLGPTFNADSCAGCHQFPAAGGSAPRYRDFWLVKRERWDGALEGVGSNGESPVRNLYATQPAFHIAEPQDTTLYARRNTPPGFGIGLLAFVSEQTILACADPDDTDGDGISGRANYEQGLVGRFGYKAQATSLESFNRGAIFNQMGITSDPLFYTFPEDPDASASRAAPSWWEEGLLVRSAHAQVSAPDEPTLDDDGVSDPEISNDDQLDLLIFSTYLGVLAPPEPTDAVIRGAEAFEAAACDECHVPRLASTIGPIPAYTDLLLHDMGPELADGITAGLADGAEFRTQPLWGVALHGPFLHDGRADTLDGSIRLHGGEGERSAELYEALPADTQADLIAFLEGLGGSDPAGANMTYGEASPPIYGEQGGPDTELSDDELSVWLEGRALFDHNVNIDEGLGTFFNADSCRACHQDPVLGGSGGIDTNVLRYGHRDSEGAYTPLVDPVLPRVVVSGQLPARLPDEANVIEARNPPTTLGVGAIDRIPADDILALHDPDDEDGDGISGRARILSDGRLGRFGWKAQIPSVLDFAADALLNENGLTVDTTLTNFSSDDDGDDAADPELPTERYDALAFYLSHLSPPISTSDTDTSAGEALFTAVGCDDCHVPSLSGEALYSDLLLHDIAEDEMLLVDQEGDVAPTEYRTPPLWGVADTAPYLHDGSAPTLGLAVTFGHFGEADAAREAFEVLTGEEQAALVAFLESL
ncbi:MAG: CxxC motif-containing protein (DUF1111 family) [Myxococcota bacterium]|jgi:CxxC motif-containing protein (DUF1111 family)